MRRSVGFIRWRGGRKCGKCDGTVTLIEKFSGAAGLGQVVAGNPPGRSPSGGGVGRGDFCQSAKRSAISVRHSGAESLCRVGRKCGEISEKAERKRCACPGDVSRFIARSRCLVG